MIRETYLKSNRPVQPIQWVYGTDGLQIGFDILDFDLATVSSVKFYSLTASGARYEATGTKNGSTVSFKPVSGFFAVGCNTLQCELVATSGTVYSFAVSVFCEENNKFEGAEQDPVSLANYIEQINKNTRDLTDLKERFDKLPEGEGGSLDTINLDDYAKADGTDQTVNIQKALNASVGKTLVIPVGTYCYKSYLKIPSNVHIVGSGDSSVLKNLDGGNLYEHMWRKETEPEMADKHDTKWYMVITDKDSENIHIECVCFEGQTTGFHDLSMGCLLIRGKRHVLDNVTCREINFYPDSWINYNNGYGSENSIGYGIFLFQATDCVVKNAHCYHCGYEGLGTENAENIKIIGGHFHDCICVPIQIHRHSTRIHIDGITSERGTTNHQDSTLSIHGTNDDTRGVHPITDVNVTNSYFSKHIAGIQGGENRIKISNCYIGGAIFNSGVASYGSDQNWIITNCIFGSITLHGQNHIISNNICYKSDGSISVDDMTSIVRDNMGGTGNIRVGSIVYSNHRTVNAYAHTQDLVPLQVREVPSGESFTITLNYPNAEYKWQYSTNSGSSWNSSTSSSATTNAFVVESKAANDGRWYRCKITEQDGSTLYSVPVILKVKS